MLSTKANVGLFALAGTVLFALGLFWIGDRKKLFSRSFDVETEFAEVAGLENGANVRVAGLDAGEVKEIVVPQNRATNYRVRLRLERKFHPMIRQDSIALIETDGLVGNKYLEIDRGSEDTKECADPCTIASMETFDLSDLVQEARGLLSNTDEAIQHAGDAAQNLNRVLSTFLVKDENGKNGAANLSSTVANAQAAMANLADNTEALKHNFLFRGFFDRRGFFNLSEMTSTEYRESAFAKDKKVKREWLAAKDIFIPRNGTEELSDEGRKRLNDVMAGFVAFLPNSPIMVEGYSASGPPDDRYRRSQQRAMLVQTYITQHFQINPKYIGAIPLTDTPPPKAGKDSWDGIALVLVPAK
jgi:phospholipid/cholesterol/gamma-HCH transport system substrate-binding protein